MNYEKQQAIVRKQIDALLSLDTADTPNMKGFNAEIKGRLHKAERLIRKLVEIREKQLQAEIDEKDLDLEVDPIAIAKEVIKSVGLEV